MGSRWIFGLVLLLTLGSQNLLALCVQVERASLHSGPGEDHPKSWEAIRYTPLKRLGKQSGWYQVENVDRDKHWIREDLVTTAYPCVVIQHDFANLRSGPGTQYPVKGAGRGVKHLAFRLVKTQADWLQVEDAEGDRVWIHAPLTWGQVN